MKKKIEKLITQFIKFGLVGGLCFVIDYAVGIALLNVIMAVTSQAHFEVASVIGSVNGFIVSVIVNYILSFKYVFKRKEGLNKKVEFTAFLVLSVIGLLLNSLIIWFGVGPIYSSSNFLRKHVGYNLMYTGVKIVATMIVMIYNFITRKIFLEQKEEMTEERKDG